MHAAERSGRLTILVRYECVSVFSLLYPFRIVCVVYAQPLTCVYML